MSGLNVTKIGKQWIVTCTRCSGTPFPFEAVVRCAENAWNEAMWWALWHNAEHDRTRCGSCDRDHRVPSVTILDDKAVKVGERMFVRDPDVRWREVA